MFIALTVMTSRLLFGAQYRLHTLDSFPACRVGRLRRGRLRGLHKHDTRARSERNYNLQRLEILQ